MQMKKTWKIVLAVLSIGVISLAGVACSGNAAAQGQPGNAVSQSSSNVQAAKNLILSSDMVSGSGGTVKVATSCVLTSQYKPGNQVVFRMRVYDPVTGQPMDDKALSSVTVSLPDGQTFTAKYSGHPAKTPADSFWATSWVIPDNYPTGTLSYKATATATDGRTGVFDNFNVQPSLLTIVQ